MDQENGITPIFSQKHGEKHRILSSEIMFAAWRWYIVHIISKSEKNERFYNTFSGFDIISMLD